MWITLYQAHRQDLAVGGPKNKRRGQKPEGGPHFENTVLDVCSNMGAKREMGGHIFQMGGRAPLAPQLTMALVCILGHCPKQQA